MTTFDKGLQKLRSEWEKSYEVGLEIPIISRNFQKLYVVFNDGDQYTLHRYFKCVDTWMISVDLRDVSFSEVCQYLRDDKDLKEKMEELE